jgi:hypothetical protein
MIVSFDDGVAVARLAVELAKLEDKEPEDCLGEACWLIAKAQQVLEQRTQKGLAELE